MLWDLSGLGSAIANIIFISVAVTVIIFFGVCLIKWLLRFKEGP